MGPLIGVFMTGPLGAILGVAGYFISRWLQVSMATQWRVIIGLSVLLVAGTILSSFPAPEFKAFIVNCVVVRCRSINALQDELIASWQERVDNIKSQDPATGWKEKMSATLQAAPGVAIDARILHRTEIRVNRKPWNRGMLFAVDRTKLNEQVSYFDAGASCASYEVGMPLESFVEYGNRKYAPSGADWPPTVLETLVMRGEIRPVPTEFRERFGWVPPQQ